MFVLKKGIFSLSGHYRHWYPIIAIPARNEEDRLPALLRSLRDQTWFAVRGRRLNVVVVLNNCDDTSAKVAIREAAFHPNLFLDLIKIDFPAQEAHVGSARRLAMDRAWQRAADPMRSVLLTTDADAIPAPTWIEANLRAVDAGADLVGGQIVGDEAEEASLGSRFLQRAARHLHYAGLVDRLSALIDPLPYDPWHDTLTIPEPALRFERMSMPRSAGFRPCRFGRILHLSHAFAVLDTDCAILLTFASRYRHG
jgi:glycosyltransferase involved in cell wall biosynthesis